MPSAYASGLHTYLVCFDIQDDRNRRKVGGLLEAYGLRVQKSVFEICLASPTQVEALRTELCVWLEEGDDLRFYHLCKACRGKSQAMDGTPVADFPLAVIV